MDKQRPAPNKKTQMNSAQRKPLDGVFGNETAGWLSNVNNIDDLKFADLQVSHGLVLNDALNNIRIGTQSLESNTSGTDNISFGYMAMQLSTATEDCTAIGQMAMQYVTGGTAHRNVALGYGALQYGLNPVDVVALGTKCCYNADDITSSVVIGNKALGDFALAPFYNATSVVVIGTEAGYSGPGSYSTICGHQAGYSAMLGSVSNSIYGFKSGYSLTTADTCTLIGTECGYGLTTGGFDHGVLCAVGYRCGYSTNADYCTYVGSLCCGGVGGGGNYNTAIGYKCLYSMQTATNTLAGGYRCGEALLAGTENVLLGSACVQIATTGSRNCIIGSSAAQYMGDGVNDWVIVGTNACKGSVGSPWTAVGSSVVIGKDSCLNVQGVNNAGLNVAIGTSCLKNVNTLLTSTVAIGNSAGENVQGHATAGHNGYHVLIGENAGKGVGEWSAEPCVYIGYQAGMGMSTAWPSQTAAGSNVGIGHTALGACTSGRKNVCIGYKAGEFITTGVSNVLIGTNAGDGYSVQGFPALSPVVTTRSGNVCIGLNATSFGGGAIAIGYESSSNDSSVSVGYTAEVPAMAATAVGSGIKVTADYSVALGFSIEVSGLNSIAIGSNVDVSGTDSLGVGKSVVVATNNTARIGTSDYFTTFYIGCGALTFDSDRKIKQDIEDIDSELAVSFINKIRPRRYKMVKAPEQGFKTGFISQEMQEDQPKDFNFATHNNKDEHFMEYQNLHAMTIKTVQVLLKQSKTLLQENKTLKTQLELTNARLAALELCCGL